MADIRGIGGVNPIDGGGMRPHRVGKAPRTEGISDRVEISVESVKAARVAELAELAKTSPDIRPEVVEEAMEKVRSGAYLEPGVTRIVAEKILDSL